MPVAAIVGRPNVGKSTLFNRLVGRRRAIVHNQPGVTRDRISDRVALDDDRECLLIDTGGLVPDLDPLGLNEQVRLAVEESDVLILVVDGKEGLIPADEQVWHELRAAGKPTILVVNKADVSSVEGTAVEFHRLGIEPLIVLSAEHGTGIGNLREALAAALSEGVSAQSDMEATKVAIVGRPNVGKSSLVNRLMGEARVLVSEQAGTTRDPVDSLLEHEGQRYLLVDTAGIRRRSRASGAPEELAIMMAEREIEQAQVAVLVIDADQGVTSGDLTIAGSIWEAGRAAVVAMNKWDLLDEEGRAALEESWPRLKSLLANPERVNVSALTGRAVERLFPAIDRSRLAMETKLSTGELNRRIERLVAAHQAPSERGHPWRFYYATQVGSNPPTFMLFANRALAKTAPYRRYLENGLRRDLGLEGVPLRLVIRKR